MRPRRYTGRGVRHDKRCLQMWWYNLGIGVYSGAVKMVSPFMRKAALWYQGRRDIFRKLEQAVGSSERIIWFHAASLGEFEQGGPVRRPSGSIIPLIRYSSLSSRLPGTRYAGTTRGRLGFLPAGRYTAQCGPFSRHGETGDGRLHQVRVLAELPCGALP